jgi:hypothetical protein
MGPPEATHSEATEAVGSLNKQKREAARRAPPAALNDKRVIAIVFGDRPRRAPRSGARLPEGRGKSQDFPRNEAARPRELRTRWR